MSTLSVSLLGGFRAVRDGVPIRNFRSQKTQSLLAYLMIHRQRAHPRAILADRFWDSSNDSLTSSNLRSALYSLRQVLEGSKGRLGKYVLIEGDSVHFNAESSYWLDVEEFEKSLAAARSTSGEARAALLRQAIEFYQGDLLADFYDDWVLIEQQHFKDLYLHALKELIAYHQERREYDQAIAWAQRALEMSSLQEEIHQALMRLYALQGDRTAALTQYAECEAVLKRELNLAPSPETRTLYEKISQGESLVPEAQAVSGKAPRHNLPRSFSSFIGRKREMAEIKRLLTDVGAQHAAPLLTLTGAGGSGKTRLALQVARDLVNEYADGVWLVELASLADPELIPQTIASALGMREDSRRSILEMLCDYLQTKELLLVLDNCEHLVTACAQVVETLLQRCPNLRVLATSREALDLAGEVVWKTPSLLLPDLQSLPPRGAELVATVKEYEAVQLFIDRATFSDPEFELTSENAKAVAQICQQLDGMPLAIELAVARLKVLSIQEIADRLKESLALLTHGSRTALPKQDRKSVV